MSRPGGEPPRQGPTNSHHRGSKDPVPASPQAPLRVLVVEDDPAYRLLLESVVDRRGLRGVLCESAEEGLRAFQEEPCHLALLDKELPGMTGLELAKRLREMEGAEDVVVVFITGDERMETLEAALDAGADDYITKDTDPAYVNLRLAIAERAHRQARAQRKALEEATRNALTDALTGLATRALLRNRIREGINRRTRTEKYLYGLLHLDLDGFGRLNDRLGKAGADEVLVNVARRLEESVRLLDTPARLAADEFAVFLDDLQDGSDVARVTNRIRQKFAEPLRIGNRSVYVSMSMGIALGDPDYRDPEEVFRSAAKALRRAKAQGSGAIRIFDPVLHRKASAQVKIEEEIRTALEEDRMVLHYQPIVCLAAPGILGFEALMRWPRSDGGFVPAQDFIPVAERSGLLAHMGWWTLERVCCQLGDWHRRIPTDPAMAAMVNVPGRQFSQPELVPSVLRILETTDTAPEHLHLEITETSAMENLDWSVETLQALRGMGIHLHVDDFGTGYSSLSYLHRLPVDSLKVDRAFVSRLSDSREDRAIVRTIVDLARSLGLSVVAEGVETPEQLEVLRELGCEFAQGWLFSKALSVDRVEEVLGDPASILGPLGGKS